MYKERVQEAVIFRPSLLFHVFRPSEFSSGSAIGLVMFSTGLVTSGQALPCRSATGGAMDALHCNVASVERDSRRMNVRCVPRVSKQSCSVSTFIRSDLIIWQEDTDGCEQLVSDENVQQISDSTVCGAPVRQHL